MPEIQTKDKLITLEELGAAIDAKAGVTSVNSQTGAVSITPANIGAVNKAGDTMTGMLTIDDANTATSDYAEIVRFKRSAMRDGDNVMLYLGKEFSTKNCGTILYHHAGDGSNSNYLALSAYNAVQTLRSYFDGHIELVQPLGVPYGGTGATTSAVTITNDYSSVLNAINAVRGTRIFPISIQKNGTDLYSDMPSGLETNEWNLLLFGDAARITALLHIYTWSSLYLRNCFNGGWTDSWTQIH